MDREPGVLGLVVNPIAGAGGPTARWGSDAIEFDEAIAHSHSLARATSMLEVVARQRPGTTVLTAGGAMGADAVVAASLTGRTVYRPSGGVTTAADTTAAVDALVAEGANLILFAGGDGTARDVGRSIQLHRRGAAVLGIPTGVKMYSSCFAVTPSAAGLVASMWLGTAPIATRDAEVLDIDESLLSAGTLTPTLAAVVPVPEVSGRTQARKSSTSISEADAVARAVEGFVDTIQPGVRYLLGPGGTMAAVERRLGVVGSALGVDVLLDGELVAVNATEQELIREVGRGPSRAVVTVIGGQGFVLGRGNQQISAEVIRRLDDPPLVVVASERKLLGLEGAPLLVDTGDAEVDQTLAGYLPVITGPRSVSYYSVHAPASADRGAADVTASPSAPTVPQGRNPTTPTYDS